MKVNWIKWRNRGIGLIVVALLVGAFIVGRWTVQRHAHDDGPEVEAASLADEEPGKVQVYYCSMHPTQQSTNPNDLCPICAMDLIPMPDDGDDDPDAPILRLSPRSAALMQVAVWPAERKEVHREIRLFGQLDYDETRLRTIAARYPGRLDRLFINFTGTSVARDQALAEIYSPPLITAQEELFQAIRAMERAAESPNANRLVRDTATSTLEAAREKLRLLGLTPVQIDELETDRRLREHMTIHAPFAGVVTQRHATEGAYIETGEPIFSIADLTNLWVNLEVYETDLAWLSVGDEAVFTTQAHPGEEFTGEVTFIDPVLDPRRRTVRVRVEVPNANGRLKPGMFVRGAVNATIGDETAQPLVIPATAPLITGRRAVVYVQITDDERLAFEGRQITLGVRAGEYYVVEDGLDEGDLVVSRGAFMIDSELQIRGRPSMMQAGGTPALLRDHGSHVDSRPPRVEPLEAPAEFAAALSPVYERYVELQVALADDDLTRSREAAKRMHAAVAQVDAAGLKGDARDVWRVLAARLRTDHNHVDHLDIEPLREVFETYSKAAIEMGQRFGCENCDDLVVAWCPMAFDDAGAHWIQRGQSIANPYFGSMMFRCGDVIEPVGHHGENEPAEDAQPIDAANEFLAALDPLYAAYFEMQNALAADDFSRSHTATTVFHDRVRDIDEASAPEQWSDLRDHLLTDESDVAGVDDIEVLRKMFEPWAMAMIDLSKTFRHSAESGHFLAHCPMAFDWEGASWLQADNVINNPYFGATMLRCGTIRERIEPREVATPGSESRGTEGGGQ